jgi:ribonuclease P protein component
LKRRFRLTSSTDFKRVRRLGKSYAHPFVVIITLPNNMDRSRFAIAAGRSLGNAVQRNKAKRILREAVRPLLLDTLPGWDVVILARNSISNASFPEISAVLNQLFSQANLLEKTL